MFLIFIGLLIVLALLLGRLAWLLFAPIKVKTYERKLKVVRLE